MDHNHDSAIGQLARDWDILKEEGSRGTWVGVPKRVGIIVEESAGEWTTNYTIVWEDGVMSTHWAQEVELIFSPE